VGSEDPQCVGPITKCPTAIRFGAGRGIGANRRRRHDFAKGSRGTDAWYKKEINREPCTLEYANKKIRDNKNGGYGPRLCEKSKISTIII